MKEPLISIRDFTLDYIGTYGTVKALDKVNLDIYEGETLALVGESGCGKTTLARSIIRLLPSNAVIRGGHILLNLKGKFVNLLDLTEDEMTKIRGSVISMIFQEPSAALSPVHTIKKQILDHYMEKILGRGISKLIIKRERSRREGLKRAVDQAIRLLQRIRMPAPHDVLEKYPHELSGGMKQRAMIASALILRPKIIVADEPTTALDVTVQAQILKLLNELKREFKTAIVFITHNLAVAAEIADRIAVMYAGQLVEVADTYKLFKNPIHPYTRGLIKSIPKPHVDEEIEPIPGDVPSLVNPPSGCRFHPRCAYAKPICSKLRPDLRDVDERHMVACHVWGYLE